MEKLLNKLTRFLIITMVVLFYLGILSIVASRCVDGYEHARTVAVGKTVPESFPVLVVSQNSHGGNYTARIVYQWALADYLKKTPNWSFTVPESKEDELNEQINSQTYDIWHACDTGINCPFGAGGFEVKRLADGKQQFLVDGSGDDDSVNRGWYTADAKHFYPEHYVSYFGPGTFFISAIPTFLIMLAVLAVDLIIRSRMRKRIADPIKTVRLRRIALVLSLACLFCIVALFMFSPENYYVRLTMFIGMLGSVAATEILSFWALR